MKKQLLLVTLAGGIAATTAACGSDSKGSSSSSPAASVPAASAAATATPSGPKPELRSLNIYQKEDYNTYPVAKMLEEKTGYKVKYDQLPSDKANDKLNLLISSAEPYDAVTIAGGSDSKALFADYAKKGALVDLTPLIDKYGPNIKAAISAESFEVTKVDGKIYGIPTRSNEMVSPGLLVRKDWLDKLGIKEPTTLDELTAMLKLFKDKDPGGNGAQNVPLTIRGENPFVANIVGAFGMANSWNDVNGKLVPQALDPAYKEYTAYMNDLYKQGLLDKEFAVNKDAIMKEKFTSGKAGAVQMNWSDFPTITDALVKNNPNAKMVFLPALKGKDGKAGFNASAGIDRITFIPKASKNPEEAVKWMNAKLDPATFKNMAIGEEGKHYTFKDGAYLPILPIFTDERNIANNYLMGVDEKNYPTYWQARVRKDQRLFDGWHFLNVEQPASVRFPDPMGLAPYLPTYTKNNAALTQMVNDYTVKLIVGGEPVSAIDEFVKKYNAAGGEASVKEVNDWYTTKKK